MKDVWPRGEDDKLIPQDGTIKLYRPLFDVYIAQYQEKADSETVEQQKAVYLQTIEKLTKLRDEETTELGIMYTPLLHYEIVNIKRGRVDGKAVGCDGSLVDDMDADVCAKHCFEPEKTYDEWVRIKDHKLKGRVATFIYDNSFPEVKEDDESTKKVIRILTSATSMIDQLSEQTTSSTKEDIASSDL